MNDGGRHVCMLPQDPKNLHMPPTASYCRQLLYKIHELYLPCEWHHGSVLYIRSQRSLKLERDRQLNLGYRFIWHPFSPIKFYWNCFALLVNIFSFLHLPFQVFRECPTPYNSFIIFTDIITIIDIYTKFVTGQSKDDGRTIILDPKQIARNYLSGTFTLDVIAALPFQIISNGNCEYPVHTAWFILKLCRFISLKKQWKNLYKQFQFSYIVVTSVTVIARIVFFFHWTTFVYYQIPLLCGWFYYDNEAARNFILRFTIFKTQKDIPNITTADKYTSCLSYVCGLIIGSGHRSRADEFLEVELITDSIIALIGLVFLVYASTTFIRLLIYNRYEVLLYNGRLKELQEYMLFKQLPIILQRKIMLYINYKFYEHYFNEQAILNTINDQLKQDINMHCCKKLVMNVPLFQDMPVALINAIVFGLTQVLYMPGETVVKSNMPGKSLYLIYSGTVAMINSAGREVAHLRDGSFFGDTALMEPGSLRHATVIALEITEMYKLSSHVFQACLQPYPHLKRRLEENRHWQSSKRRGY